MNNKTTLLLLSLFVFLSINANAATYTVAKIADTNEKKRFKCSAIDKLIKNI